MVGEVSPGSKINFTFSVLTTVPSVLMSLHVHLSPTLPISKFHKKSIIVLLTMVPTLFWGNTHGTNDYLLWRCLQKNNKINSSVKSSYHWSWFHNPFLEGVAFFCTLQTLDKRTKVQPIFHHGYVKPVTFAANLTAASPLHCINKRKQACQQTSKKINE